MMSSLGVVHTGAIEFDIAARESQVAGERQRIEPLAFEEISREAKEILLDLAKSFGGDVRAARKAQIAEDQSVEPPASGEATDSDLAPPHIPPILATLMRHPILYRRQMELSMQLIGGAFSPRERELVVLRVAWLCRAPYEWGEHVALAKLCDLSAEEIERVTLGSSAEGWNDHERAILRAVEELLGDHSVSDETWNALAGAWNDAQLIELPVLVGVYHMMALQQNSLKVRLPEHNKGLRQR